MIAGRAHPASLTLSLRQAPKFYQIPFQESNDVAHLLSGLTLSQPKKKSERIRSTGLSKEHKEIAGSCLVYRVNLNSPRDIASINTIFGKTPDMPPSIRMHTKAILPKEPHAAKIARLQDLLAKYHGHLGFEVSFQVMALVQNGFLSPQAVLELLPKFISMVQSFGEDLTAQAIGSWVQSIPYPGPDSGSEAFSSPNLASDLQAAVVGARNNVRSRLAAIEKHPHLALVHRVTITPTGVYLEGPSLETKNRVLRKYPHHTSQFVRVTFADEDGEKMFYERGVSQDHIFRARFGRIMEEGVRLGGHLFEFLGFSHSSLREHTSWFMCQLLQDGRLLNAKAVTEQLGNFGDIRTPAKCAARIGQAFSETNGVVDVNPLCVQNMPDVERNTRTFSDGVGTVSLELLQKIWREHPLTVEAKPTMYQIRFEGNVISPLSSRNEITDLYGRC